jgi:hypothetical protein
MNASPFAPQSNPFLAGFVAPAVQPNLQPLQQPAQQPVQVQQQTPLTPLVCIPKECMIGDLPRLANEYIASLNNNLDIQTQTNAFKALRTAAGAGEEAAQRGIPKVYYYAEAEVNLPQDGRGMYVECCHPNTRMQDPNASARTSSNSNYNPNNNYYVQYDNNKKITNVVMGTQSSFYLFARPLDGQNLGAVMDCDKGGVTPMTNNKPYFGIEPRYINPFMPPIDVNTPQQVIQAPQQFPQPFVQQFAAPAAGYFAQQAAQPVQQPQQFGAQQAQGPINNPFLVAAQPQVNAGGFAAKAPAPIVTDLGPAPWQNFVLPQQQFQAAPQQQGGNFVVAAPAPTIANGGHAQTIKNEPVKAGVNPFF